MHTNILEKSILGLGLVPDCLHVRTLPKQEVVQSLVPVLVYGLHWRLDQTTKLRISASNNLNILHYVLN